MKTHHARTIRAGIMEGRAQHKNELYLGWKLDPPEGHPKLFMRAWDRTLFALQFGKRLRAALAFPFMEELDKPLTEVLTSEQVAKSLGIDLAEDPDLLGPGCCEGRCQCA